MAESSGSAVRSGLKVFVDGSDISHDTLPVWSLCVHHFINVLEQRNKFFYFNVT